LGERWRRKQPETGGQPETGSKTGDTSHVLFLRFTLPILPVSRPGNKFDEWRRDRDSSENPFHRSIPGAE
jgi:hypothetical protein